MNAPKYTDLEVARFGVRLMEGESLDIVPEDLRPFFEGAQALAQEIVDAQPPPPPVYETVVMTPSVCELYRSMLEAAGCRPGEFSVWLREAQRRDRGESDAVPTTDQPKARPRLLKLSGHALSPTPHPRRRHLQAVRP